MNRGEFGLCELSCAGGQRALAQREDSTFGTGRGERTFADPDFFFFVSRFSVSITNNLVIQGTWVTRLVKFNVSQW